MKALFTAPTAIRVIKNEVGFLQLYFISVTEKRKISDKGKLEYSCEKVKPAKSVFECCALKINLLGYLTQ